ncbi:MAG: hypothetical protein VB084_07485 [Syntrophomonadaceae bacterium]|nr:hypothetical protein [Syntrophomonadaceae bacterium]
MFTSLQIKFLIFIAIVAVITVGFAILIMHQLKVVGDKALEVKRRQIDYQQQLETAPADKSNEISKIKPD